MGIVGHKIHTYLTATGTFRPRAYTIIEHAVVHELHATKGWRLIRHRRKEQLVGKLPPVSEWRACHTTTFIPTEREAKEHKRLKVMQITPAMIMRHRERRRDEQRAQNIARNKLEDQRLAGLR